MKRVKISKHRHSAWHLKKFMQLNKTSFPFPFELCRICCKDWGLQHEEIRLREYSLQRLVMLLSKFCTSLFSPSSYLNPYHLHMLTRCFMFFMAVAKCTQTALHHLQHFVSQVIFCQFSSQQCHYGGIVGDWLLFSYLLFIQLQAP